MCARVEFSPRYEIYVCVMNIQDRIVTIIAVIQDKGQGLTRKQLQENLAILEDSSTDWESICDRAMEVGLLKIKNQKAGTLTYTPEGKKFRKKPYYVSLSGDSTSRSSLSYGGEGMDEDLLVVMRGVSGSRSGNPVQHVTSARSKLQLKLIRAIDRKIALDDFAQSENIDLNEALDNLEDLRRHGKHLDISYFVNEVIGINNLEEVRDSMSGVFNVDTMRSEWGDVYNEEELRLLCYVLS